MSGLRPQWNFDAVDSAERTAGKSNGSNSESRTASAAAPISYAEQNRKLGAIRKEAIRRRAEATNQGTAIGSTASLVDSASSNTQSYSNVSKDQIKGALGLEAVSDVAASKKTGVGSSKGPSKKPLSPVGRKLDKLASKTDSSISDIIGTKSTSETDSSSTKGKVVSIREKIPTRTSIPIRAADPPKISSDSDESWEEYNFALWQKPISGAGDSSSGKAGQASSSRQTSIGVQVQPLSGMVTVHRSESDCNVCIGTFGVDVERPGFKVTQYCTHPPNTCTDCVRNHIKAQLESVTDARILCPQDKCLEELYPDEVYRALSDDDVELIQKYEDMCVRHALGNESYSRCPWEDKDENGIMQRCTGGQVYSANPETPAIICVKCLRLYCPTHKVPWHDEFTCEEYDREIAGESGKKPMLQAERDAWKENEARLIKLGEEKAAELEAEEAKMLAALASNDPRAQRALRAAEERQRRILEMRTEEQKRREAEESQEKLEREGKEKKRRDEINENEKFVNTMTRPCPNCKSPIQKTYGCDFMICSSRTPKGLCNTEFCFLCLYVYKHGKSVPSDLCYCYQQSTGPHWPRNW